MDSILAHSTLDLAYLTTLAIGEMVARYFCTVKRIRLWRGFFYNFNNLRGSTDAPLPLIADRMIDML